MFVDASVWIDYFNGVSTAHVDRLSSALEIGAEVVVGDLVIAEVLQGFRNDASVARALRLFDLGRIVTIGGRDAAVTSAENYRKLRARGITIRKTIDTLIATWCIRNDVPLLHRDRDFEPFVEHLGLKSAMMLN